MEWANRSPDLMRKFSGMYGVYVLSLTCDNGIQRRKVGGSFRGGLIRRLSDYSTYFPNKTICVSYMVPYQTINQARGAERYCHKWLVDSGIPAIKHQRSGFASEWFECDAQTIDNMIAALLTRAPLPMQAAKFNSRRNQYKLLNIAPLTAETAPIERTRSGRVRRVFNYKALESGWRH